MLLFTGRAIGNTAYCGTIRPGFETFITAMAKKILLVDLDDVRRASRITLLERAGYEALAADYGSAASLSRESDFSLVIVALHQNQAAAMECSDVIGRTNPNLLLLFLVDHGVAVPAETSIPSIEAGQPRELMQEIASILEAPANIEDPLEAGRKARREI